MVSGKSLDMCYLTVNCDQRSSAAARSTISGGVTGRWASAATASEIHNKENTFASKKCAKFLPSHKYKSSDVGGTISKGLPNCGHNSL